MGASWSPFTPIVTSFLYPEYTRHSPPGLLFLSIAYSCAPCCAIKSITDSDHPLRKAVKHFALQPLTIPPCLPAASVLCIPRRVLELIDVVQRGGLTAPWQAVAPLIALSMDPDPVTAAGAVRTLKQVRVCKGWVSSALPECASRPKLQLAPSCTSPFLPPAPLATRPSTLPSRHCQLALHKCMSRA